MTYESETAEHLEYRKMALQRRREYYLQLLADYANDIKALDEKIEVVNSQLLELDLARRLDRD